MSEHTKEKHKELIFAEIQRKNIAHMYVIYDTNQTEQQKVNILW